MNAPVETPLLCESAVDHVHTAAPEFSPSDLRLPTSDLCSEQLPASTFAPPPVDIPAEDYDSLIAELNRLEAKCQLLKLRISFLDFAEPVES